LLQSIASFLVILFYNTTLNFFSEDEPIETSELVVEEGNRQAEIYNRQHHSSSVTVEAAVSVGSGPIVSSSVVPAGLIRAVSSLNSSGLNVRGIGNNSTTLYVEDGHPQGAMLTEMSLSVEESHQLSTVNQLSSVDYELNGMVISIDLNCIYYTNNILY
jgi:hypothetical protein